MHCTEISCRTCRDCVLARQINVIYSLIIQHSSFILRVTGRRTRSRAALLPQDLTAGESSALATSKFVYWGSKRADAACAACRATRSPHYTEYFCQRWENANPAADPVFVGWLLFLQEQINVIIIMRGTWRGGRGGGAGGSVGVLRTM